jgi:hypothetical protein
MSAHEAEFWDALQRDMPSKATSMVEGGYISPHLKSPQGVSVCELRDDEQEK